MQADKALVSICKDSPEHLLLLSLLQLQKSHMLAEPVHEISNNVLCATSKALDQPAHTRSLIRTFASRLSIL